MECETKKRLCEKGNITYEIPNIDDDYTLNDTKLKVISISDNCEELNDTSIVLKVTYKNNSFLLLLWCEQATFSR